MYVSIYILTGNTRSLDQRTDNLLLTEHLRTGSLRPMGNMAKILMPQCISKKAAPQKNPKIIRLRAYKAAGISAHSSIKKWIDTFSSL